MSKWQAAPVPMNGARFLTTRAGAEVGMSFHADGFHLSVYEKSGVLALTTLEPADALELARAIQREYGGRDE